MGRGRRTTLKGKEVGSPQGALRTLACPCQLLAHLQLCSAMRPTQPQLQASPDRPRNSYCKHKQVLQIPSNFLGCSDGGQGKCVDYPCVIFWCHSKWLAPSPLLHRVAGTRGAQGKTASKLTELTSGALPWCWETSELLWGEEPSP